MYEDQWKSGCSFSIDGQGNVDYCDKKLNTTCAFDSYHEVITASAMLCLQTCRGTEQLQWMGDLFVTGLWRKFKRKCLKTVLLIAVILITFIAHRWFPCLILLVSYLVWSLPASIYHNLEINLPQSLHQSTTIINLSQSASIYHNRRAASIYHNQILSGLHQSTKISSGTWRESAS